MILRQLVFAKFPINKRGIFVLKRAYNSGQITSLGYYILSNQSKSIELWKCYSTTSNINSCVKIVLYFLRFFHAVLMPIRFCKCESVEAWAEIRAHFAVNWVAVPLPVMVQLSVVLSAWILSLQYYSSSSSAKTNQNGEGVGVSPVGGALRSGRGKTTCWYVKSLDSSENWVKSQMSNSRMQCGTCLGSVEMSWAKNLARFGRVSKTANECVPAIRGHLALNS